MRTIFWGLLVTQLAIFLLKSKRDCKDNNSDLSLFIPFSSTESREHSLYSGQKRLFCLRLCYFPSPLLPSHIIHNKRSISKPCFKESCYSIVLWRTEFDVAQKVTELPDQQTVSFWFYKASVWNSSHPCHFDEGLGFFAAISFLLFKTRWYFNATSTEIGWY